MEEWLEFIADDFDRTGDAPGWETIPKYVKVMQPKEYPKDVVVTVSADMDFVRIKTYDRQHGSRGRFIIYRNAERYDVWYCNHKYKQPNHDQTPVLREEDIKAAFEKAASEIKGKECPYSEDLWRSLVKTVTVFPNESMEFLFADDNAVTVLL